MALTGEAGPYFSVHALFNAHFRAVVSGLEAAGPIGVTDAPANRLQTGLIEGIGG
jgi:hypothetical protein